MNGRGTKVGCIPSEWTPENCASLRRWAQDDKTKSIRELRDVGVYFDAYSGDLVRHLAGLVVALCGGALEERGWEASRAVVPEDFSTPLGNLLRSARKERKWSRARVALLAHCSASYLWRIEGGGLCPSESVARKIARALRIDSRDFLEAYQATRRELDVSCALAPEKGCDDIEDDCEACDPCEAGS